MATGKMEARSESEEEHLNSLHPQKEQKEASAPPKIWKYRSVKDILIGILVFLVITLTITIIAVTAPRDAEPPGHRLVPSALCGPPCPHRWIGYAGKCYHFSKMKMNWNSSSSYCKSHNASLARIGSEEQEFVKHLTGPHYFWIGLRRDPGQPWKWLNGENSTLLQREPVTATPVFEYNPFRKSIQVQKHSKTESRSLKMEASRQKTQSGSHVSCSTSGAHSKTTPFPSAFGFRNV
nr:C-type lectin domain family 2 member D-like isoform X1 [Zootoca vivipara]